MAQFMGKLIRLVLLSWLAIGIASCSKPSGPPQKVCYPVKGKLLVGEQPAVGAMVIFHPEGSTPEEWTGGYPRARVGEDGMYELETYGEKDGAPAGEYRVLVTWTQTGNEETEDTQMVDKLKGRYSDASRSTLKAKVEAGPTEVPVMRVQ
jgi:hypothetical protein